MAGNGRLGAPGTPIAVATGCRVATASLDFPENRTAETEHTLLETSLSHRNAHDAPSLPLPSSPSSLSWCRCTLPAASLQSIPFCLALPSLSSSFSAVAACRFSRSGPCHLRCFCLVSELHNPPLAALDARNLPLPGPHPTLPVAY